MSETTGIIMRQKYTCPCGRDITPEEVLQIVELERDASTTLVLKDIRQRQSLGMGAKKTKKEYYTPRNKCKLCEFKAKGKKDLKIHMEYVHGHYEKETIK